jgi:glutathione S-transferase
MKYASVAEGRKAKGLRIALTIDGPAPWSESAKSIMKIKKIPFLPIRQVAGDNPELAAWAGHGGAPIAFYNDEKPLTESIDILHLAERLAPTPSLVPKDMSERVLMFGLTREIIGTHALGWQRRLMMLRPLVESGNMPEAWKVIASRYNFQDEEALGASAETAKILLHLDAVLAAQKSRGKRYFVGNELTAVDIYWACFSNIFAPLREQDCPVPEPLRSAYSNLGPVVGAALTPALLAHRDFIWAEHIGLPMDFMDV